MTKRNLRFKGIKEIERAMRTQTAEKGSGGSWIRSAMAPQVEWEWRPRTKRWIGVNPEQGHVFLVNSEGMVMYYRDCRAYHFALDSEPPHTEGEGHKPAYAELYEYLVMRKYAD